jgi:hypothetical protein
MISSMSFLALLWSSQFWLHLFWTTHLQGMSLRRTGVWCGHASSGTLIGIQETLSFIVFLWVYIGFSQRCDRKKSYVIDQLLLRAYFFSSRSQTFWKHQAGDVLKWEQEFQWRWFFVHRFSDSISVSFLFFDNIMFWQKGQSLYISEQYNAQIWV